MIKFSSNDLFWILFFLNYSFGVAGEKTNTFIRSRGSLENHTQFKTLNGQNLYPFSNQNGSKTIPFGAAHTYVAYIGEYPLPPPGTGLLSEGLCAVSKFTETNTPADMSATCLHTSAIHDPKSKVTKPSFL